MFAMTQGPHGPQRSSDGGAALVTAGEANILKGEVLVPDYNNVSGLVDITKPPGDAKHPESVFIKASSSASSVLQQVSTVYAVATQAQATKKRKLQVCFRGYVDLRLTDPITATFRDLGITPGDGGIAAATTGQVIVGSEAGVAGTAGQMRRVLWRGDRATFKP